MNKPLGILIPVYNEKENIGRTIESIEIEVATPHKLYLIYDFDQDNTLPAARELQLKGIDIGFIKNPIGGVSNAIKMGFEEAEEKYLLVTMADHSDDYTIVDEMCRFMEEGSDVVCGSRYMRGGRQVGGPVIKKTISRMAGLSLRYVARLPVHDVTNSFKLYRKSMVDLINIESKGGFEIGMEIVLKAHFSGFNVTEIPCTWYERQKGRSRFRLFRWMPKYLRWYVYALQRSVCHIWNESTLRK